MKVISKILLCFTIFVTCLYSSKFAQADAKAFGSKAEIVMEQSSGRVLHEYNADEKLPMASTTKILTAITVLKNFDVNQVVVVGDDTCNVDGSSVYLKSGDKYTALDLLYGLMLRSGNDCAETLAIAVSGGITDFSLLMNETAKSLGANDSHFSNPHGLPCDGHYTTARDLCNITRGALNDSTFREIVSTKRYVATEIKSGKKISWTNKNKFLSSFEGADGVKTGFTKEAGRCYVGSATRDGMQVITVLLDCPDTYGRCRELTLSAFDEYKIVKIFDKSKFDFVSFTTSGKPIKLCVDGDGYYPLKNGEAITAEISLPEKLPESIKKGEEVGEIKIFASKQLIFSQKIYTL